MSNTLKVHQAKGFISVQDLGRFTAQSLGFSASGAADEYAFLSANKCLDNPANTALLEVTFGQVIFSVSTHCQIILTGANCQPLINQQPVEHWQVLSLKPNDIVTLQAPQQGIYTYIGITGGIQVPKHVNSASALPTALQSDFSSQNKTTHTFTFGISSSTIHKDEDEAKSSIKRQHCLPLLSNSARKQAQSYYFSHVSSSKKQTNNVVADHKNVVRFIPHQLWYEQSQQVQKHITQQRFAIDNMSNKMGYRLKGQQPIVLQHSSVLSKPVALGAIQVPNDGHPIVLMKDRQTMGGYPTIGNVIQVDIPRLAQLNTHQCIQFFPISIAQAQAQLMAFNEKLNNKNKSYI